MRNLFEFCDGVLFVNAEKIDQKTVDKHLKEQLTSILLNGNTTFLGNITVEYSLSSAKYVYILYARCRVNKKDSCSQYEVEIINGVKSYFLTYMIKFYDEEYLFDNLQFRKKVEII